MRAATKPAPQVPQNFADAMQAFRSARANGNKSPWGVLSSRLVTEHNLTDELVPSFKTWARSYQAPTTESTTTVTVGEVVASKQAEPKPTTVSGQAIAPPEIRNTALQSPSPATGTAIATIEPTTLLYNKKRELPDILKVAKGANEKQAITETLAEQAKALRTLAHNNPGEWFIGGYVATKGDTDKITGVTEYRLQSADIAVRDEKQAFNVVNKMLAKLLFTDKRGAVFALCGTGKPIVMAFNLR